MPEGEPARRTVDPVLEEIVRLLDRRRSQAEVAVEIGVKRATLASWLAHRRALRDSKAPPSGARMFDYTRQPAQVQELIARAVAQPRHQLHELSARASASQVDPQSLRSDLEPAGVPIVAEQLSAVMAREFASTVLTDPTWIAGEAHRVAQVVERVPGVSAVFPVLFDRGDRYRIPYHYQLTVFVRPEASRYKAIERAIEAELDELRISANWEHWALWPAASLELTDGPRQVLASLIVPVHEAARAPKVAGVLPPPAPVMRLLTVLSSDYGGSKPVGGWLAKATGAGLIEGEDAARTRVAPQLRRRPFAREGPDHREMGWINEMLLHLFRQDGGAPGAWCFATETRYPSDYQPLARAVATASDVLVTLHQGPEWQRMAAWRIAKARWDDENRGALRGRNKRLPLDEPIDGARVSRRDKEAMGEIAEKAETARIDLDRWERCLDELVAERAGHLRPTVTVTIERLPEAFPWAYVRDGSWACGHGTVPPDVEVNYLDAVDVMLDTWTEAAAEAFLGLAGLARLPKGTVRALYREMTGDASPFRQALEGPRTAPLSTRTFGKLASADGQRPRSS